MYYIRHLVGLYGCGTVKVTEVGENSIDTTFSSVPFSLQVLIPDAITFNASSWGECSS